MNTKKPIAFLKPPARLSSNIKPLILVWYVVKKRRTLCSTNEIIARSHFNDINNDHDEIEICFVLILMTRKEHHTNFRSHTCTCIWNVWLRENVSFLSAYLLTKCLNIVFFSFLLFFPCHEQVKWKMSQRNERMHFNLCLKLKKLGIADINAGGSGKLSTWINILLAQVLRIVRSFVYFFCWYNPFKYSRLTIVMMMMMTMITISTHTLKRHQPYDQRTMPDIFLIVTCISPRAVYGSVWFSFCKRIKIRLNLLCLKINIDRSFNHVCLFNIRNGITHWMLNVQLMASLTIGIGWRIRMINVFWIDEPMAKLN